MDGAELMGIVTMQFNASDDHLDKVLLYIDQAVFEITGLTSYNWNTTRVGDGIHTIKIVASDKAENTAIDEISVTTINVQKANEESYKSGREEGYVSGRNFGLEIGMPLGLVIGAIIVYAVTRRRPKPSPPL